MVSQTWENEVVLSGSNKKEKKNGTETLRLFMANKK